VTRAPLSLWLCLTAMIAVYGRAGASDVTRVLDAHFRARGATEVGVLERVFLFEGASHALPQVTNRPGCVGFLVIGGSEVRDVDVTLFTPGGLALDEDVTTAPYGYVRACAAQDVPVVIGVNLIAGRGELTILRIEAAPRELGRLPGSIVLSVVPGGRGEDAQALDTPAEEDSVSTLLASEETQLSDRGYLAGGAPEALELQGGQGEALVALSGQHCVRIVAHAPGVRGLTLQIEGPEQARGLVRVPDRDLAELAFCPRGSGPHRLRARARAMRAMLVFRVFEHPRAPADRGDAELALGAAEVEHQWAMRGFATQPLGDAWVESREPARFVVDLSVGRCYGVAAASAEGTTLDLRLVDPEGRVVSRTEGRGGVPVVYACPRLSGRHTIVLTSRGRDQRASAFLSVPKSNGGTLP